MTTEADIPDGGWGWVIVACSFLIHMLVVGTMYSLSVVYVAWLDYFGDGKGVTSWIISLSVAVMFGIGPLPGVLSKWLGNRGVVILGSILMSCGFAVSFFAVNVYFLIISIGIVTGTGAGCCFLPSVSMVTMYFTTKRSVAMGIAASGLGAGTFCMAPFLDWLIDFYGWRGCMLILSGISLNICILGALMRPLKKSPNSKTQTEKTDSDLKSNNLLPGPESSLTTVRYNTSEMYIGDFSDHCYHLKQDDSLHVSRSHNNCLYSQLPTSKRDILDSPPDLSSVPSVVVDHYDSLDKSLEKLSQIAPDLSNKTQTNDFSDAALQQFNKQISNSKENQHKHLYDFISSSDTNVHTKISDLKKDSHTRVGGSMEILNIPKTKYFPGGKLYSSQMDVYSEEKLLSVLSPVVSNKMAGLSDVQLMLAGSIGSILCLDRTLTRKSRTSIQGNCALIKPQSTSDKGDSAVFIPNVNPETTERIYQQTDDPEKSHRTKPEASTQKYIYLLKDCIFMVFGISNFLTNVSFFMPVLYMVDRALNSGIKRADATMLISLYGAGNIFGKLFFGWLADRNLVDRSVYYIGCITLCGAFTSASPLCGSSHELHSIYAFTFGCFIGAYATLVPLVTVDLMGISLVTESFGLLLCFMGIATAFGTPVAGLIFDWTGSYTISFVLHGIILLVSALMLIPLLVFKRRHTSAATV